MYPRWIWRAFAAPGIIWLLTFFVVAFYAIVAVAFGTFDEHQSPVPYWNPLDWNVGWFHLIGSDLSSFRRPLERTLIYVGAATVLSLLIGYPVAYYVARRAGRWRGFFLLMIVLPLWISYLMRMLAWVNLLASDGWVTRGLHAVRVDSLFRSLHLLDQGASWLDGQGVSVVLALVYGYVPFLILPIYAAVDRIDQRVIEAARDLGASPRGAFFRVTLPLSASGVMGGIVLIALPMFGDYYTNDLISKSPKTNMIGNQINEQIQNGFQKPIGAALTVILSILLAGLMAYYLRQTHRAGKEASA